jgi:hypothetical protein
MLMVIFGAGASYDSVPSCPPTVPKYRSRDEPFCYRPPLASDLFDNRELFVEALQRFPRCQPVVPYLEARRGESTVERELERLQSEAVEFPERHRQLAAVRYYLQFIIRECVRMWNGKLARGITNYKTLFDHIECRRKHGERVCLVTFNYDMMLEEALPTIGLEVKSLYDYISHETYKLIKLHGSVNWGREVDTGIVSVRERNAYQIAAELIEKAPELKVSRRYRLVNECPIAKYEHIPLVPAIAIPVETKQDYECPDEHLDLLKKLLPSVTKILVVGWRATESHFLRLLADSLAGDVKVLVAAGGRAEAQAPIGSLRGAGVNGHFDATDGGFTQLVKGRQADALFAS